MVSFHAHCGCLIEPWVLVANACAPPPFTSFKRPTRGVTLCEFCHADNSNIPMRGNIVFVFVFIRIEKTRVFYSLNFVFMVSSHAHCCCLINPWVVVVNHPSPHMNAPMGDVAYARTSYMTVRIFSLRGRYCVVFSSFF